VSFIVVFDHFCLTDSRARTAQVVDEGRLFVSVRGLISKFNTACGRTGTDRQFLYVNGRPCTLSKVWRLTGNLGDRISYGCQVQKAFNEVYRSFNATQSPFLVADFIVAPGLLPLTQKYDLLTFSFLRCLRCECFTGQEDYLPLQ